MAEDQDESASEVARGAPIPITTAHVAQLFSVTEKTVRSWIRGGLPVLKKGGRGRGKTSLVDLWDLIPWYLEEHALDVAKTRLATAQAEKHEMDNAVRRGDLADLNDASKVWAQLLENFRSRMRSSPTKLAPLVSPENPNRARDLIAAEHDAILSELASLDEGAEPSELPPPTSIAEGDSEAAAGNVGKRVGRRSANAQQRKQRGAGPVEH